MTDSAKINNPRVAGIVILYNPDNLVINNIKSYLDQIEELVAFDNSDNPDDHIINEIRSLPNVHYYTENNNLGIGYALNYGAHWAIKNRFDYLLTMDQDSYAADDMISKMLLATGHYKNIGIIIPYFENKYRTHKRSETQFSEILFEKTSGNLLNLSAYLKAGPFNEGYFIDYVDLEYCMRMNVMDFKVIQVNDAVLFHNEAEISKNKFLFYTLYPMNHSPIRLYYKIRNLLYFRDEYQKYHRRYFRHEFFKNIKLIIKILLYEQSKMLKYKYIIEGYNAYKKGITGKYQKLN